MSLSFSIVISIFAMEFVNGHESGNAKQNSDISIRSSMTRPGDFMSRIRLLERFVSRVSVTRSSA